MGTIAVVATVGIVALGLGQLAVMYRGYRTIDQAQSDAARWRLQAHREAAAALQLRRRLAPPPLDMAAPRPPLPDPPLAQQVTRELATVEPTSGSVGTRKRGPKAVAKDGGDDA